MAIKVKPQISILLFLMFFLLPLEAFSFDNIKNIPARNYYFTGRMAYFQDMQIMLSQYGKVYLTGYGGIGKTQIAKEFSHLYERDYDLIWWFDSKGDLELQYENLLTHLSNNKKFNKLININIKDISPGVMIDFTNSLFEKYNYNWLLVFDNVVNDQDLKLPKTKANDFKKHIIITTREKKNLGNNVLTVGPFANKESEQFLFKVHPKEKKEELIKLSKTLYNYPLALAQISDEILMHGNGVEQYLANYNKRKTKSIPLYSNITQKYNNSYHEVLDHTLQEIEQKDKDAAKVLYMLVLLRTDITKKLLNDLFGNKLDNELIVLNKHGIVQTVDYGDSKIVSIHDVIRDVALKKFNGKAARYRKEIICVLGGYFNKLYLERGFEYFNNLDVINNQVTFLYSFIDQALQNNIVDDAVINTVIISLKLNDDLFNRYANYVFYQQLANKIYNKNLDNISSSMKALLYANLVYADFIFESEESLLKFEKEMLRLLKIVENSKNYNYLFFIYTYLTQLYLFLGDLQEATKYLGKAEEYIKYAESILVLLQYYYINAWLCDEHKDIHGGIKAINNYKKLRDKLSPNETDKFFSKSFMLRFRILGGQKNKAKKELEETIKSAALYYHNTPSQAMGKLEFTKALIYFQDGQYDLAIKQCNQALNTLNQAIGGDIITINQSDVHMMLGELYEVKENYKLALVEYKKCLKYYHTRSYGRAISLYAYGKLLSHLCSLSYKQNNYLESKFYFQELVANFGLEHELVVKLIKKPLINYRHQVGT